MNLPNFAAVWTYVGPLIGAIIGVFGKYLLDMRRERLKKREGLQVVECVELVNTKALDEASLGPIAADIQIKVPKSGPGSEPEDVEEIYFTRYRFRNLSDVPVSKLLLDCNQRAVWFSITEGEGGKNPDWGLQLSELLKEFHHSEARGWEVFPIPYLNPYASTGHEVYLNMSSYLPLNEVEISGGAKGVKFISKKLDA